MKLIRTFSVFILLSLITQFSFAESSDRVLVLPESDFRGRASFETLNQDTFIPVSETKLSGERSTTLDSIKWSSPYTLVNYGFPGGATNVNLGGRSSSDTQVTTLGVPINLPQGNADFSIFPSFLWSQMNVSTTTSGAGFSPGAASGRIEFLPWTRENLLNPKLHGEVYRGTVSYDHDSQTYSLGTRNDKAAVVVGASTVRQEGISGEASVIVFQNNNGHLLLHVIGTSVEADSPGSLTYPSPKARFKNWRAIPVAESSFHLADGWEFQSTSFADLSSQVLNDPDNAFNSSDTRTQSAGLENVLQHGFNVLTYSLRYVHYTNAAYGERHEWPMYASYTHEFFLSDETSMKAGVNGTAQRDTGIYPGARVSFKFANSETIYPFAEINTVAKMPSITDRYSVFGAYHGNPDLKTERVYAALAGYHFEQNGFKSVSTLKAERRQDVQVQTASGLSLTNAGSAYLYSLNEEVQIPFTYFLDFRSNTLVTYSRLENAKFGYPDLPYFSTTAGLAAHYRELASLEANSRFIGFSPGPGGKAHPGYALFDLETAFRIAPSSEIRIGLDNVFDSHAQAILDYPLEGRRFFAALSASL